MWTKHDRSAAAILYRRALSIDESMYGSEDLEDPEVASAAAGASLYRALTLYEKAFGPGNAQALKLRKTLEDAGIS